MLYRGLMNTKTLELLIIFVLCFTHLQVIRERTVQILSICYTYIRYIKTLFDVCKVQDLSSKINRDYFKAVQVLKLNQNKNETRFIGLLRPNYSGRYSQC